LKLSGEKVAATILPKKKEKEKLVLIRTVTFTMFNI